MQTTSAVTTVTKPTWPCPYPLTEKKSVTENWHGAAIVDNYAWLQAGNDNAVKAWTASQNAFTRQYLDSIPEREKIKAELKKYFELGSIGTPSVVNGKQFQWRRQKDENHSVLYVKDLSTGTEETLLNSNTLSKDGTVAVDWTKLSHDGSLLAYGISSGGTERSILKIKDVNSKVDLKDEIPYTRACSIAWLHDNTGFYYTRYPELGTVPEGEENYHRTIYFHKLGTNYKDDAIVYAPKDHTDWPGISISEDGKWMTITVSHGWTATDVYISNPLDNKKARPLFIGKDNILYADIYKNDVYMFTNYKAPKGKIMKVSLDESDLTDMGKWKEVIPEEEATLSGFKIIREKLILTYEDKACSRVDVTDLSGQNRRAVELPAIGSVSGFTGRSDAKETYYSFDSFTYPDTIYKFNIDTLKSEKVDGLNIGEDLSNLVTKQVTYTSKDGTPVTMFLVHRNDIELNGENKTLLYGYGGFAVSEAPSFAKTMIPWLKQGGIYAVANLRGGAEYGEEWHRAGMLEKKQNVFDDFIAAAEYLIKQGYTKPEKLAISGGSNGGLLVGATLVQRPDLFRAVLCSVPLLDMIHYDQLEIAKLWIAEYGDPSKVEHFKFLHAYSPYHNVVDGTQYPAVLLKTADGDSRVDPMHAKKMAARLQESTISNQPVLLFVDEKAGHGAGKPTSKQIESSADSFAFLASVLE